MCRSTAAAACCSTMTRARRSIRAIGAAHRRFGTTGFLPTLISDDLDTIGRAIAAVQAAIDARHARRARHSYRGTVSELARARGVHDAKHLRLLDDSSIALLCGSARRTHRAHARARNDHRRDDRQACRGRASWFRPDTAKRPSRRRMRPSRTGCAGSRICSTPWRRSSRATPGIVGAALYDPNTWCGIIVDGHHVDPSHAEAGTALQAP